MVEPVMVRDVIDRITATGQLVAKAEATIAAQIPGQVTTISVEEGDAVFAGQILLEIDPQRRELELASAEAQLNEASAQAVEAWRAMDRIQNLNRRDAASQARLDEARTALKLSHSRKSASEARLGLAKRALSDASVSAPFSGLVARRNVSVGEYLSVGLPLFEIVTLDPIETEFSVAEVDSGLVLLGQDVELSLAPFPGERFAATVTMVSPTIDSRTRTLRVKAELPNGDGRLRPGLFAHIELGVSERSDVVMVPEEALLQRASGSVLFRIRSENRVEQVLVETGVYSEGWVEVRGDLYPGDRVVVRGQGNLLDGGAVSVRNRDGRPVDPNRVAAPVSSLASGVDG
jgi:membrane fusion protein (multidrug efflux system)